MLNNPLYKSASTAFTRYVGRIAKDPNSMERIKDLVHRTSHPFHTNPHIGAASALISEYDDTEKLRKAVGDMGNLSIRAANKEKHPLPYSRSIGQVYDDYKNAPRGRFDTKERLSKKDWASSVIKQNKEEGSSTINSPAYTSQFNKRPSIKEVEDDKRIFGKYDHNEAVAAMPTYKTYAERMGIPPETMVDIEHGGGYSHINKFIKGEGKGYRLENVGDKITGLQVSPSLSQHYQASERTPLYAARSLSKYIDSPGVLKAKIEAGKLLEAPNKYEAGLPYLHAKDLKDVKVEKPYISGDMYEQMAYGTEEVRDAAVKKFKLDQIPEQEAREKRLAQIRKRLYK